MDFLKNLKLEDNHKESSHETPPPAPAPKHESLLDKLSHKISGEDEAPAPAPPPPQPPHPQHQTLLHKLGDAIDGGRSHAPPPPPPQPEKPEGLFDAIGDALRGEKKHPAPPPPPPKPEGLLDKLEDVLHGGKHEQSPPKPQTLGEKLESKVNNALGGGKSGEAKEDHLDKTIDFVQEHIFKAGRQDDESVIEQAKDKQIANAIREGYKNVTGHEFFVKEKQ